MMPTINHGPNLLDLPNELILEIANHADSQTQLSRMSRTNRRLYELLISELLRRNIRDDGSSAVLWAFRNDHIEMLSRLHSYGANLCNPKNMPPRWGTLLSGAAQSGNMVMVEVLIQLGVDPMQESLGGYLPLVAALSKEEDEIARLLIPFLPSLEYPMLEDGRTALHVAAGWQCGKTVKHLLEMGADPNFKAPGSSQSTFDELLGENGVEYFGEGAGDDYTDDDLRNGAFRMLTVLLENGAEPDDEAFTKGATSPIARVRHLFCDREVNVSKRRVPKARLKSHQEVESGLAEGGQLEERQDMRWKPAESRTKMQHDAYPPLQESSVPSMTASQQSWNPLKESLDKRFPPLAGPVLQGKESEHTLQKELLGLATNTPSQSDLRSSEPKKGKQSNRKWQKLQL